MKGVIKNLKDCYWVKICYCFFKFYSLFFYNKWLIGMCNYMKVLNLEIFKFILIVNFFDVFLLWYLLRKSDFFFNMFVVLVIYIVFVWVDVKMRYYFGMFLLLILFWWFYKCVKFMEIFKIILSGFFCFLIEW